jgi:hypothetical protein
MWWILSWDLLTGHCKNKLVYTTVKYFKMATPSNVNKTINEEKITPDAKRVKLFSGVWCWKNGLNIWHCQLRNEASSLNHHLFQSHLFDSSQCACGDAIENNFHYFYVCPLFIRHRIQLFNSLRKFQDVLNLDILLKGSPILTVEENTEIFDAVHHFITGSRRFTWFNRFSFSLYLVI